MFPLFWLPLLPCYAPPPCLLCSPLSLLVWLPRSVCLCCSSPCLLVLLGAPVAHPLLSHPPAPPHEDFTTRRGLSRARLVGHGPVATPMAGTSRRVERSSRPCGVCGHFVEGGGGLLMALSACAAFGGCCSARTSWYPCVLLCVLLGLVSLPCVGQPYASCFATFSSQSRALSFSAGMLIAACVRRRGGGRGQHVAPCIPLWLSGCHTFAHVSKSTN